MKSRYILKVNKVYGISVTDKDKGVIDEIFLLGKSKQEVCRFVKLCNAERLEPIHLKNAINDMLY